MLHIVKNPQQLALVSRYLLSQDALLLVENAVYAASQVSPFYSHLPTAVPVYALQEDLQARGWLAHCPPLVEVIDMDGWVDATVKYGKSITW
ncbi:sulfurtransferase complex subunit TusB [Vibrio sp. H11]|uniref:sulfurtransferase complex subunit TusB n=1 Tax=Vibrio sp. H11 TaxID=2565928 RepID=UPI0010A5FAD7|nr:sulfurtransferase complex subunit TusB [Vibrio sp. H11]